MAKVSIFEALTDSDIEKLSEYTLTEKELSYLLSLLELINDENKAKAFEFVDALFKDKKLVEDEEKTSESVKIEQARLKAAESYTRKLLGNK